MSALLNTIGENMKNLNNTCAYAHKRGKIQDSAVKAIVTDPLFHSRSERNKKGKGSYRRHEKHRLAGYKNKSPFKSYAKFLNGLFL